MASGHVGEFSELERPAVGGFDGTLNKEIVTVRSDPEVVLGVIRCHDHIGKVMAGKAASAHANGFFTEIFNRRAL